MIFVKSLLVLVLIEYCYGAPKPVDWDDVGRKINEFRNKVSSVAHGACDFVNNVPDLTKNFPQYPNFQPSYNNPFARSFPRNFPSFRPQFPFNFQPQFYPSQQVPKQFPFYPKVTPKPEAAFPLPVTTIPVFPVETQTTLNVNGNRIPEYIPPKDQVPQYYPSQQVPDQYPFYPKVTPKVEEAFPVPVTTTPVSPLETRTTLNVDGDRIPEYIPPKDQVDDNVPQYYPSQQVPNQYPFYPKVTPKAEEAFPLPGTTIPVSTTVSAIETQTTFEQNDLNVDVDGNKIPEYIPPNDQDDENIQNAAYRRNPEAGPKVFYSNRL